MNNGLDVFISGFYYLLVKCGVQLVIPPSGVWYWLSVIILNIISHKEQIRVTCELLGIIPNIVAVFQRTQRKFKKVRTNQPKEYNNNLVLPSSIVNDTRNKVSNDNNTDCRMNYFNFNNCNFYINKNDDNK